METLWFILLSAMLVGYVILDGFDLGAGTIHLWAARTDDERRSILRAIGPVWDGNETWLVAAGGTMFFAFPLLYASSFSGFYLPLNMVLWLLIGRGVGIELRKHVDNILWRDFFDVAFAGSSLLLALFFGAALGNVVRGVPLEADFYFFLPLWTDFTARGNVGVLDWYTVLTGLVAVVALAVHGALYVALKTSGVVNQRCRILVHGLWPALVALTAMSLVGTLYVRPGVLDNYREEVWGFIFPALAVASLLSIPYWQRRQHERAAFFASAIFLTMMLAGAAFGVYPQLLTSPTNPHNSITIYNAAAGQSSLRLGVVWWSLGMVLAIGYFVLLYWLFRGKVAEKAESEGY
jgi:cytochrome d ubiquinol oxidase subunit II